MVKSKTCLWLTLVSGVCVFAACSSSDKGSDNDDPSGGNGGAGGDGEGGQNAGGEAGIGAGGGAGGAAAGSGGAAAGSGGATAGGAGGSAAGGAGGSAAGGASGAAGGAGGMAGNANTMSFFITSEKSPTGNLGGIAMADAKCKRLAEAAGIMGKTWAAYLSTSTENARARIGTGPWYNQKGVKIADNLEQLHEENGMKNNLTQETALTDKGEVVPGRMRPQGTSNEHDVLTGSTIAGMVKMGATCNNWTSTMGASGVGHADRQGIQDDPIVAASWNAAHNGQCGDTAPGGGAGRYYCFAK